MAKRNFTSTTKPFVASMQQTMEKPTKTAGPTREQIAARAYEIYCERCRTHKHGNAVSDWASAEADLRSRSAR